jgi:hypothetical protein
LYLEIWALCCDILEAMRVMGRFCDGGEDCFTGFARGVDVGQYCSRSLFSVFRVLTGREVCVL